MLDKEALKDVRKIAFQVGAGFTLGKLYVKCIEGVMIGVMNSVFKNSAKNGNKAAQDICNKLNIKYEEKTDESK